MAAVTTLDVYNMALTLLGATQLSAVGDTPNGPLCTLFYERVCQQVLSEDNWLHQMIREGLEAETATEPEFGFDYHFLLSGLTYTPAKIVAVYSDDGETPIKYAREGGYILADADEIYVRYVREETDPANMHPKLVEAIALKLAMVLATKVKASRSKTDGLRQDYERVRLEARMCGLIEFGDPDEQEDGSTDWINARN